MASIIFTRCLQGNHGASSLLISKSTAHLQPRPTPNYLSLWSHCQQFWNPLGKVAVGKNSLVCRTCKHLSRPVKLKSYLPVRLYKYGNSHTDLKNKFLWWSNATSCIQCRSPGGDLPQQVWPLTPGARFTIMRPHGHFKGLTTGVCYNGHKYYVQVRQETLTMGYWNEMGS